MAVKIQIRKWIPKAARNVLRLAVEQITYPPDFSAADIELCDSVAAFTMTSPERTVALANLVRYVVENEIAGEMVECGVWRGGSMMTVAKTLLTLGETRR